jgi:N-acetylglutamate synthase-like GNAT family acetyltransferase
MIFREIVFGSDDFRKECELRNKVLRAPLGLSLFDEDISIERKQMHFGMFDECGNLLACAAAVNSSANEAKIRQMAVDNMCQGKGYGRSLLLRIEDHLARLGFVHLFLHARMSAVGFYEKLGYARVGQEFIEVGLPHVRMEKNI